MTEEEAQSPIGTESDAQRIVLRQFLNDLKSGNQVTPIVDLGSGKGVLAHEICGVWPDHIKPLYVAVDLLEPLRDLQIPLDLFNGSRKHEFSHFFENELAGYAEQGAVFVLRNVFHELNISETAKLLFQLKARLSSESVIYVQDMVNLPVAERNHVGWEPANIKELFEFSGFEFHHVNVRGRSGTDWYSGTMRSIGPEVSEQNIVKKCFELRQKQQVEMLKAYEAASDYSEDGSHNTYLRLSLEIAALVRQLDAASSVLRQVPEDDFGVLETPNFRIPLSTSVRVSGGFALERDSNFSKVTGCVGALRDKDHIDFPKLIEHSHSRIWFAGYSQKLTFRTEENRVALRAAVQRGVDLRMLILDPESTMVQMVGKNRLSHGQERLREGIANTLEAAGMFQHWVLESGSSWPLTNVRLADSPFPGSYFFVDGTCFFSTYTRQTTGSRAPCLIYERGAADLAGYFEILEEDFLAAWDSSSVFGGGSDEDA